MLVLSYRALLLRLFHLCGWQLDTQSTRQQELLYNAEFQIQQMERKVGSRPADVARGMVEG
jgi:hypothetical protein